ncbi:MAG: hypothetical protein ACI8UO_003889 [Verrucomicrobiales bacterium]|jgi:hypothetical protein
MKGFFITILILGGLGAGGWFAYDKGYLDGILPAKSSSERKDGKTTDSGKGSAKPDSAPSTKSKADTTPKVATLTPAPGPKRDPELERKVEAQVPMPNFVPLLTIVKNWDSVPPRAFPAQVTVNVEIETKIERDGKVIGSSKLPAGSKAKPLAYQTGRLQVAVGTTKAIVAVDDTDFKEQIEALYNGKLAEAKQKVAAARNVAREALSRTQKVDDPKQLASGWHDSMDPRFKPVRDHLASGKLESGILEEAKDWQWLGSERHGGGSYDVVLVHFEVKTLFGIFPNTMKCLLRGDQVVKWVDADTGEERT